MLKFLEYIQSNKSCYIDTGYIANINTQIDFKFNSQRNTGNWLVFIGAQDVDDSNTTFQFRCGLNDSSMRADIGTKFAFLNMSQVTDYIISLNKDRLIVNGTSHSIGATTMGTPSVSLYIGGVHRIAGFTRGTNAIYYYVTIKENDTVIKELVPAELDGVVGMYDKTAGQFLNPVGTFIGGPVIHTFSISPTHYNFNETGETITAVISGETSWDLTSTSLTYYSVSPTTGESGSTNVTISVGANETYSAHNEDIVFTDNDEFEIKFKAKQKSPYQNSNIYIGETRINNIYIGDTRLSNIYYGENSIFN